MFNDSVNKDGNIEMWPILGIVCTIFTLENVHVLTGGVLPVLAQQWISAVWGIQCGFAGGGGAGGTHSQETQHHQPQGTVREQFSLKPQCKG